MERDIRSEILDELRWDPRIDATKIAVTVIDGVALIGGSVQTYVERHIPSDCSIDIAAEDGRVTLTGTVHTCAEGDDILDLVWCAPGVRAVDDRISILP